MLQPSHLKAAKLPKRGFASAVVGICPRCGFAVTKEHLDGGDIHRLGGKPLHPDCFFGISWREPLKPN